MAKPSLYKNPTWQLGEWYRRHDPEFLTGDKKNLTNIKILNGTVCFECEIEEAFNIYVRYSKEDICKSGFVTVCHDEKQFYEHSKFSFEESHKYFQRFPIDKKENVGFAYHFENVKPIDPMPITELYKDEACKKPLTRAPQSYCFAYEMMVGDERFDDWRKKVSLKDYWREAKRLGVSSRKVLVFSIRSPWLCKIANGEKDLEVRKTRILNAGIEYK